MKLHTEKKGRLDVNFLNFRRGKMAPFYGDALLTMIFLFFLLLNVFSHVHGLHYSREELFSHRPGYSDVGLSAQKSWDDTFFISVENAGSQNNNKHGGQQRKRGRRGG